MIQEALARSIADRMDEIEAYREAQASDCYEEWSFQMEMELWPEETPCLFDEPMELEASK
jgi:hypothetical protein